MTAEKRATITEPEAMAALAHPVRLALLSYLAATGPATASQAARAVGDTPSNCSYHLRVLAGYGLVGKADSADGRERPWQALVTGLDVADGGLEPGSAGYPEAAALLAIRIQRDQLLERGYLDRRAGVPGAWRAADQHAAYTLAVTPAELTALAGRLDELIRPYLAPTRDDPPRGAALVHLGLQAFVLGEAGSGQAGSR
jgi:DNA-binding transcriptional ArsR family regulator